MAGWGGIRPPDARKLRRREVCHSGQANGARQTFLCISPCVRYAFLSRPITGFGDALSVKMAGFSRECRGSGGAGIMTRCVIRMGKSVLNQTGRKSGGRRVEKGEEKAVRKHRQPKPPFR
jgi:hypothetical protein